MLVLALLLFPGVLVGAVVGRWQALAIPLIVGLAWWLYLAIGGHLDAPEEDAPGGRTGLVLLVTTGWLVTTSIGVALRLVARGWRSRSADNV